MPALFYSFPLARIRSVHLPSYFDRANPPPPPTALDTGLEKFTLETRVVIFGGFEVEGKVNFQ